MISLFIAPSTPNSGLTSSSLGLLHALDSQGIRATYLKPVAKDIDADRALKLLAQATGQTPPAPISLRHAQQLVSAGKMERLLEDVVALQQQVCQQADIVIVEGLVSDDNEAYTAKINASIAKALNADVVLVANAENSSASDIEQQLSINGSIYGGLSAKSVIGCILNKVGAPEKLSSPLEDMLSDINEERLQQAVSKAEQIQLEGCPVLAIVPWQRNLTSVRCKDIIEKLKGEVLNAGEIETRRVNKVSLCARTVPNMTDSLTPGTLIVTPGDRHDIIMATALAESKGTPIAGLLLTGGIRPDQGVLDLCDRAMEKGLPIFLTEMNTFTTASRLAVMDTSVPSDDKERAELIVRSIAEHIDMPLLMEIIDAPHERRLSPAAFRYQLVNRASANKQRVVLPEGEEPRTIQAAIICQNRNIADCILLGRRSEIEKTASAHGVTLPDNIQVLEPDNERERYIAPMVEMRKHKQLNAPMAKSQLEDNVVLGTMMLALDHVDGLVSGAIHTTANTIRPALQLIKTAPGAKLVSSVFFMCLPEQVLVYGDCAVNPDPSSEELADIAIQSAGSALSMGIEPKVAMISYSTGSSGQGSDVEKVKVATDLIRQQDSALIVDGPLQYDAATTASVAKSKAPNSPVAGQATVLVFPDLNTGNTTYKAVQRSANVISVGPMLQGLRKPVNDLSRGALIEDIVYTIALTAIQAQNIKK